MMFEGGVLSSLVGAEYSFSFMQKFCVLQEKYNAPDVMARLFIVAGCKARLFENSLRLSHAQKIF